MLARGLLLGETAHGGRGKARQMFQTRTCNAAALLAALSQLGAIAAFAEDEAVRQRVEARLARAGLDRGAQIQVEVKNDAVILNGAALTVDAQRAAERAARQESKVVENQLKVVPAEPRSDAEVRKAVGEAIVSYPNLTAFDSVELGVEDGVVLLHGSVQEPHRGSDIEGRVAKVPGVREIRNELAVQSLSSFDERLRAGLYRSIYGNERFARYAKLAPPPIRILVDRGHLTLTGHVESAAEQAALALIAGQSLAFTVENQVRVRGEAEPEGGGTPTTSAPGSR
jgi:osmotically-inducible protein OsmY